MRRAAGGRLAALVRWRRSAIPAPALPVLLLALLGDRPGVFTPANNAQVMAAVPARDAATAGGMVSMTRGLGTALGVAG